MIDLLILNNQNRGLEAAGVALQQVNGSIQVFKEDVTPLEFIHSLGYKEFMAENLHEDTLTAIGHTRKVTKGTPRKNENNHPMWAGVTAVVHNGQIFDDDHWFKQWKLERKAETDSDIFRALLDKEGFTRKAVGHISQLSGNGAFAAISTEHPGKLLLGRSGNPLEMAATSEFLMFSSEKGPLYQVMRPYQRTYGVMMRDMTPMNYRMIGMNDNSAWLFGDQPLEATGWDGDWLEWHQEMRIAVSFTPHTYMCHAQFHGNRVKYYDDRPIDIIECPHCKSYLEVNKATLRDLKGKTCGVCKKAIS